MPGTTTLYLGSGDGSLYGVDTTIGPGSESSIQLGDGTAGVGSPSYDLANKMIYVGTEAGIIYAIYQP